MNLRITSDLTADSFESSSLSVFDSFSLLTSPHRSDSSRHAFHRVEQSLVISSLIDSVKIEPPPLPRDRRTLQRPLQGNICLSLQGIGGTSTSSLIPAVPSPAWSPYLVPPIATHIPLFASNTERSSLGPAMATFSPGASGSGSEGGVAGSTSGESTSSKAALFGFLQNIGPERSSTRGRQKSFQLGT